MINRSLQDFKDPNPDYNNASFQIIIKKHLERMMSFDMQDSEKEFEKFWDSYLVFSYNYNKQLLTEDDCDGHRLLDNNMEFFLRMMEGCFTHAVFAIRNQAFPIDSLGRFIWEYQNILKQEYDNIYFDEFSRTWEDLRDSKIEVIQAKLLVEMNFQKIRSVRKGYQEIPETIAPKGEIY